MPEFSEVFRAYGAEYESTMKRFLGNEGMYLRLLGMLFQDENKEQLGAALRSGDLEQAFAAAHTLKGVAGNLGLTPLWQAVSTLVEPLRVRQEREDYGTLYEAVCWEFQRAEAFYGDLNKGE